LPPLPADVRTRSAAIPTLAELGLAPNPRILPGGEPAARARLAAFVAGPAARYHLDRDRMDRPGTSRLGADLKFGLLSPRAVWHRASAALGPRAPALAVFRSELVWREFAHSTLWDRPDLLEQPFRPAWRGFPWQDDPIALDAWRRGATGYPLVDAAARQLLAEGFVHNRARMVAASFLTKHLLVDFRRGEAHYLRWLTDGDWASNDAGWQWSAGCGSDAQPYFRIFDPVAQGQRFDPAGDYVRRYLPELGRLPDRFIHQPWRAPAAVLEAAGVALDRDYPRPIVEHRAARERFLAVARQHLGKAGDRAAGPRRGGSARRPPGTSA
jgi:deoxyribodipyrimidine photo-lyase